MGRLVSQVEIAEQHGVSEQAVWNWTSRYKYVGWPKPKEVHRRFSLYDEDEVNSFLKSKNLPDFTRVPRHKDIRKK